MEIGTIWLWGTACSQRFPGSKLKNPHARVQERKLPVKWGSVGEAGAQGAYALQECSAACPSTAESKAVTEMNREFYLAPNLY